LVLIHGLMIALVRLEAFFGRAIGGWSATPVAL